MVEAVKCFSNMIKGVGAYGIILHKIAEIKKCSQALDHVAGNMSSNGW